MFECKGDQIINLSHSSCPIVAADRRLCDGLNLLVETKKLYFQPDRFRLSLNNTVQSLRNVTFVLQKSKSALRSFDNWYRPWQESMRTDPLMKWLVESRNIIVKQGDLEIHSTARVSIVDSWFAPPTFEMLVPPFTRTHEFAHLLRERVPKEIPWDVGLLRVERRWVDRRLPDHEIMEALTHSFEVLSQLLFDAHKMLLEKETREHCPLFSMLDKAAGRPPPCMLAQDWDRTVWVNLRNGTIMTLDTISAEPSTEDLQKAAERYPGLDRLKHRFGAATSLKDEATVCFEAAKNILKTDGCHLTTALMGYPDGRKRIAQMHMADRTEKHLAFRKLAVDIERTGADSVILISEAWLSRGPDSALLCHAADDPNREEALQLIAANANGDLFINTAIFSRDKKGNVRIEEEHFSTDDTINLLAPIKEVWRRRK